MKLIKLIPYMLRTKGLSIKMRLPLMCNHMCYLSITTIVEQGCAQLGINGEKFVITVQYANFVASP